MSVPPLAQRLALRALLLILTLLGCLGCSATLPEGQLRCERDSDCPLAFECRSSLCHSAEPFERDAGARDAEARDAEPFDGGAGHDGGSPITCDAPGGATEIIDLQAGREHTCILTREGQLLCWGNNINGELGNGDTTTLFVAADATPIVVDAPVQEMAIGSHHGCALSCGRIFCWGSNLRGQLGIGLESGLSPLAVRVALPEDAIATSIASGNDHSCATSALGEVYCWGSNNNSYLIAASAQSLRSPTRILGMHRPAREVWAGGDHTCAQKTEGELYCWGSNSFGQLGGSVGSRTSTPGLVPTPTPIERVFLGIGQTCVTTMEGLYCWGLGARGLLGNGDTMNSAIPVHVELIGRTEPVISYNAGGFGGATGYTACAVDGRLHCWGSFRNYLLGAADEVEDRLVPHEVPIEGATNPLIGVDLGIRHGCTHDGAQVYCWGNNESGQLGNETGMPITVVPIVVEGVP